MSTTEDKPAIGRPEWYRALPPRVATHGDLKFSHTNVWTDAKGDLYGLIDLGAVDLTFRTSAQVRDLIAKLAVLAGEMDAETARHKVAELLPQTSLHAKCWQCGATQATAPLIESPEGGDWQCSNRMMCAGRASARAFARDAEAAQVQA